MVESAITSAPPLVSKVRIGDIQAGHNVFITLGECTAASKYAGKVEAFFEEYLSSENMLGRVPFGGRNSELALLDSWLSDPEAEQRFLVTAPAGRGKSALLVRWTESLKARGFSVADVGPWEIVFVPISVRYETHRPEIFYEMIAARLADALCAELSSTQTDKATYYADQCRILLRRIVDRALRTLIVIDGIDEALGDRFNFDWLPRNVGSTVRVLLSARLLVGDHDSSGWIRRLRWDQGFRVRTHQLSALDSMASLISLFKRVRLSMC
jgi:hypothetical protein